MAALELGVVQAAGGNRVSVRQKRVRESFWLQELLLEPRGRDVRRLRP